MFRRRLREDDRCHDLTGTISGSDAEALDGEDDRETPRLIVAMEARPVTWYHDLVVHHRNIDVVPAGEYVPTADRYVVIHGVSWEMFEAVLAARGDTSGPRFAYLDGDLELMSPSKEHERIIAYLSAMVLVYAEERGLQLSSYRSWTLRNAPQESGLEPDDCFILGPDQTSDCPDLAIEVIWTSGGIGKLEIYKRLGVAEVWRWKSDVIEVYVLRDGDYVRIAASECFAGLDLSLVCSLLDKPTVIDAMRALRKLLI